MKQKSYTQRFTALLSLLIFAAAAHAQTLIEALSTLSAPDTTIVHVDSITTNVKKKIISIDSRGERTQRVIEGSDTTDIILPAVNVGRYDRGLFNYLFIPKGNWDFGLTASYGEFDAADVQLLSILKDLDFKGKVYSLSPSVSYFFKNNQAVGLRFSYNRAQGDLASLAIDFDEDMNFDIHDVSYYSHSYDMSVFYRSYVGLSREKRFGIFNEVELAFSNGSSRFRRIFDGAMRDTRTTSVGAALNFSPGITMFIMDYVSFNVSFGVFGVKINRENQITNGIDEGHRTTSGANFRFNLFNIKFGASVNI